MIRIVLLFLSILALPASAQEMRPPDDDRLHQTDAVLGRVLKAALGAGAPEDIAVLTEALSGEPGMIEPTGDWNCRMIKMGRGLPLIVYSNFRCRISSLGPGRWQIEKLTGSQRLSGTVALGEGEAIYMGVGFVNGGPATDYAGLPREDQTPVEPGQTTAEVGFFEQMGPNRARILFPLPILESDFDILYLTR